MLNLIRMEFTRVLKSKSSLFIFLAMILACLLSIGVINYTAKNSENITVSESTNEKENQNETSLKFEVNVDKEAMEDFTDSGEDFVISYFAQLSYLIFLIVFGSLFFTNPYSHGFVKNFIGMCKSKSSYIFATFIVASLYVTVTFAITAIVITLLTPLINDGMFNFIDYGKLFKILLVGLICHVSCLSVIMLISNISRSTPVAIMVSFLFTFIFFDLLVGISKKIMDIFVTLPEDFTVANYTNIGNIMSLSFNSANTDLVRTVIVAIVIFIISLFLSSVIINKKDI